MTKLLTLLLVSLATTNIAWAQSSARINSTTLSGAVLEIQHKNAPKTAPKTIEKHYSNAAEQHNSIARAALAQQGTKTIYLRFDADGKIGYSRHPSTSKSAYLYRIFSGGRF